MNWTFTVEGDPKAQPRQRHYYNKNLGHVGSYDPGTADGWKQRVSAEAIKHRPNCPLDVGLRLRIQFRFARPASHYGTGKNAGVLKASAPKFHMVSKPDLDNLEKAVMDALTDIRFWKDDCLVAKKETGKSWTTMRPGAEISIEVLDPPMVEPV